VKSLKRKAIFRVLKKKGFGLNCLPGHVYMENRFGSVSFQLLSLP
jgi:hypothetical protein